MGVGPLVWAVCGCRAFKIYQGILFSMSTVLPYVRYNSKYPVNLPLVSWSGSRAFDQCYWAISLKTGENNSGYDGKLRWITDKASWDIRVVEGSDGQTGIDVVVINLICSSRFD